MEYMSGDFVRQGFGFANPNHAAAAICAAFPFCWGWGGVWRWVGRLIGAALCVMLAMTYSRTGFVVLVIEAAVLWWHGALGSAHPTSVRGRRWNAVPTIWGIILAVCLACVAAWWMWPRMALDGAVMNRPKIWLAGLRLFAANPMGVGFGNSGEIASTFLLPDGITVRTLVNSHLTLLAEMGAVVGGAWFTFVVSSLCSNRRMRRTWVAFAGLAVSAFSSSVFDWHVLFDFANKGDYGEVNFILAWGLFAAFVFMGTAMIFSQITADVKKWLIGVLRSVSVAVGGIAIFLLALLIVFRVNGTPKINESYVLTGNGGPHVYHDNDWSLAVVRSYFPNGAHFFIKSGVPSSAEDSGEVWLFGDVAESSHRFPCSNVTVVDPPEFYEPEKNVTVK